eukprot:TRINITY_DN1041_c0_g1_i1.p1 TRINITY_DN1041_c0_g1~~TRINITY_DN1041_c0_g1_i1.p1  ORF type:complete len:864 (+),score=169.79 TRINITY_DN1041_c0_g1_i1:34-2625(+)
MIQSPPQQPVDPTSSTRRTRQNNPEFVQKQQQFQRPLPQIPSIPPNVSERDNPLSPRSNQNLNFSASSSNVKNASPRGFGTTSGGALGIKRFPSPSPSAKSETTINSNTNITKNATTVDQSTRALVPNPQTLTKPIISTPVVFTTVSNVITTGTISKGHNTQVANSSSTNTEIQQPSNNHSNPISIQNTRPVDSIPSSTLGTSAPPVLATSTTMRSISPSPSSSSSSSSSSNMPPSNNINSSNATINNTSNITDSPPSSRMPRSTFREKPSYNTIKNLLRIGTSTSDLGKQNSTSSLPNSAVSSPTATSSTIINSCFQLSRSRSPSPIPSHHLNNNNSNSEEDCDPSEILREVEGPRAHRATIAPLPSIQTPGLKTPLSSPRGEINIGSGKEFGPSHAGPSSPRGVHQPDGDSPAQPLPPPPEELLKHRLKNFNQRVRIMMEIVSTERTYVNNLSTVVETFLMPLRKERPGPQMVSQEQLNVIFSNLEEILRTNRLLLHRLETRMNQWTDDYQEIGDIFKQILPFLKIYNIYTAQQEEALSTLAEAEKQPIFMNFEKEWNEKSKGTMAGMTLRAYLIMPVQRIPRYQLLLESLLKQTPEDHQDLQTLEDCLASIKKIASAINESVRQHENRTKIFEIQNSFFPSHPLIQPHRLYIKDGPLIKICRKTPKPRWFFLFNDVLIYSSPISVAGTNRYIFHSEIRLEDLTIDDFPQKEGMQYGFQMGSPKKTFIVLAATKEEKVDWMLLLQKTIDSLQARFRTLKKHENSANEAGSAIAGSGFQAPLWVPDKDAANCFICRDDFSFVHRRHHCRICGQIVCRECSKYKLTLPSTREQVRVCNPCYQTHQESPQSIVESEVPETRLLD